jgi:hypothetical protein
VDQVAEVTACSNCPLAVSDDDSYSLSCGHPYRDATKGPLFAKGEPDPPEWCPLRQHGMLIRLGLG